jgi:COMPASS component SWD2
VFKSTKQDNFVTSLDFDDQGEYIVASGDDDIIQIFDIKGGKSTKSVPSKKYGAHLARFTHHSRQVLHASTKVDGMFDGVWPNRRLLTCVRFPAIARLAQ